MKVMVMTLFLTVGGLFVGFAGLIGDWYFARIVGESSLVTLLAILWWAGETKADTLDRVLLGKTFRLKDDKNA